MNNPVDAALQQREAFQQHINLAAFYAREYRRERRLRIIKGWLIFAAIVVMIAIMTFVGFYHA